MNTRYLLHTMACPDRDPVAALALADELGLDGIELICQAGYRCAIAPDAAIDDARRLAREASAIGSHVAALVPYTKAMNSADPAQRDEALHELDHCLSLASEFGAQRIRVFGGTEIGGPDRPAALQRMGETLRRLGDRAQRLGVTLCIENHMDTMATSATATMEILAAIDHPAFGILYDQPNLDFMRAEAFPLGFTCQQSAIRHVHVKDFAWTETGARRAAIPGEGIVPWREIIRALAASGYSGYLTFEYEKRWFPDQLPDAAIGVRRAKAHIDALIATTEPMLRAHRG